MRIFTSILLVLSFFACSESSDNIQFHLSKDDLIGNWEATNDETGYMLERLYCNSFELRSDGNLAVYYWQAGIPSMDEVHGTWEIINETELLFKITGSQDVVVEVIKFGENQLSIKESSGVVFHLLKK